MRRKTSTDIVKFELRLGSLCPWDYLPEVYVGSRLDLCHLLSDLSVRPLRMRLVLVAGLSFVGEILHLIAQVLNPSCSLHVPLACGQVKLIPRVAEVLLKLSKPISCAKSGDGMIGVALPRVTTLGVSALFRRSCATSRWS